MRPEPYDLAGLRFGVATENWEVYLFGKNVTNTHAELEISGADRPVPGITRNQPRTIGVGFKTNL